VLLSHDAPPRLPLRATRMTLGMYLADLADHPANMGGLRRSACPSFYRGLPIACNDGSCVLEEPRLLAGGPHYSRPRG